MDDFVLPVIPTPNYVPIKQEQVSSNKDNNHDSQQSNNTANSKQDQGLLSSESRRAAKRRRKAEAEAKLKAEPSNTSKQLSSTVAHSSDQVKAIATDNVNGSKTVKDADDERETKRHKSNKQHPLTKPNQSDKSKSTQDRESKDESEAAVKSQANGRKKRYIVFVGNLSYSCTKDDILQLFKSMHPTSCRLPLKPQTNELKGFAFLEFDSHEMLNKALLMHHTELKGRPINVELTAGGGGGKSEKRRERIKQRNEKLTKERSEWIKEKINKEKGEKEKDKDKAAAFQ